ncbi:hypothetical protein K388_07458 [Streptomyces sp. KhCrAH-43]|uniref:hypothetical protein n=1 Tax=unclassified Streptomyces TaxID=2593676 RepID=UPI00035C5B98|nr:MULTISPECIES: hypothetical protein [unclassified Streptomyces]MYS39123.1 hypothetical protein [Streptomyces sp. SID4920]MYX63956.1 hypothetical protein [Streptomyces sp. SID8373]RAJ43001.1 hypothetical protein K388_07458 [Streptomyces sp. KhCrAH-43]
MKKPLDADTALATVRELAAKVVETYQAGRRATVWEMVKVMEEGEESAVELAKAVQELDAYASEHRQAPQEWRLGRELTPEEARGLIERHPEIAPLGETGVITLAREGFRWIQMASIVRTVQAGTTVQQ